jgi:hypothetical protein
LPDEEDVASLVKKPRSATIPNVFARCGEADDGGDAEAAEGPDACEEGKDGAFAVLFRE